MEIIKQSHIVVGLVPTDPIGNMERIELVGRCCYQSYDKMILNRSYLPFTMQMIEKEHLAMVEHSNMVIKFVIGSDRYIAQLESIINSKHIFHVTEIDNNRDFVIYFGGNYRAWMELIGVFCEPTYLFQSILTWMLNFSDFVPFEVTDQNEIPMKLKRITVFFRTNRAVTHELVRHRPPSYGQLSQRYVRHKNMQFIQPVGLEMDSQFMEIFIANCKQVEKDYNLLLANYKPQQARNVLTNAVATDIYVTADIPEWRHIFKLRCARDADPQMQDVMIPVEQKFIELGWVL